MRLGIADGFDMLVDGDGDDFGLARNIAAHHEDDAEFTDRVGEGEDDGREIAARRQGRDHGEEAVERAGA